MLLELVLMGGAVYTATKAHTKRSKQKALAHMLSTEKKIKNNSHKNPSFLKTKLQTLTPFPVYFNLQDSYQQFKSKKITPFLSGHVRRHQFQEIMSIKADSEISDEEKEINQRLTLALISMGLNTVGRLAFLPLSILSIPGLVYLSLPVLRAGYANVFKERRVGVGIVDAVIVTSQFILGYFFALSLYLSLLHFSRKLVLKTRDRSRQRLFNIFGEQPRHAWLHRHGSEVEVPVETLEVGDIVVVSAGEMIPVDGSIIEGVASIDQHLLTGEAQPAESSVGDSVLAATMVLSGRISIRVDKAGPETVAAQIGAILSRTIDFKSSVELRGEVIADKSAWPMLAFGTFSFLAWGAVRGICVLKCHFGQNLRIIAPLSVLNFLNIAAQHRMLVKDGRALELLHDVDTVVFDKTGTLTQERPHVANIYTYNGFTEHTLLAYAAAAEHKQTHPLAQAILSEARIRQLPLPAMQDATYEVGYGIKVDIGHQTVRVGSARFMEMEGIGLPLDIRTLQEESHAQGHSLVYVAIDDQLSGAIELQVTIRPEVKRIICSLQQRHKTIYIISGDHEQPTRRLAEALGVDHYFAETLPENKAALIEQLQKAGRSVCFVGDGINDSIALRKADVSVSLRGASTIATDTAQIILMDESLNHLVQLFDLAAELNTNMRQNVLMSMLLGGLCLGGVFFLNFGINATTLLYRTGTLIGVGNAMRPVMDREVQTSSSVWQGTGAGIRAVEGTDDLNGQCAHAPFVLEGVSA